MAKHFVCMKIILPSIRIKQSECKPLREQARLDVSNFKLIQLKHVFLFSFVVVLKPTKTLRSQNKPQISRPALHDANTTMQTHVAFSDHLVHYFIRFGLGCNLAGVCETNKILNKCILF